MSIVPKETIEVIAQSIGISNLSQDAAPALAPDVEYRLREIMQEAIKCMRHSRRTILTTDDVDGALNLKNVEPLYGFAAGGPLQFKRAIGHRDLFYINDKDVDFKDVIEAPLPKAPLDTSVVCHWLAIEGVQPAIPENALLEVLTAPPDSKKYIEKDELSVDIKLPVKHILSIELQLYFEKIKELTMGKSDSIIFKEVLVSLATDPGLHPLVPYFTQFIADEVSRYFSYFAADEVSRSLRNFNLLFGLMRLVHSLLQNPYIHIEPYLHQLMPSVVTCLVAKKLGNTFVDNHWELRDFTANLVAFICRRFEHVYNSLQSRLTKTLLNAFLDPRRSLTQHYGAIQGLAALGPNLVRLLIVPNLQPYMQLLEPEMHLEKQKNEMKRHEAWRVYGALLNAAGHCIYDRLKMFPLPSTPSPHVVLKVNQKVATTMPIKRKTSTELVEQPQSKTMAVEGPSSVFLAPTPSPSQIQGEVMVSAVSGPSNAVDPSTCLSQQRNGSESGDKTRNDKVDTLARKKAILAQIWKDDFDSGNLLVSLFEIFGESILCFIPTPEKSFFV